MDYNFTADEILEVAIRIEANGASFYRKAAAAQPDESNRAFLEQLANMEDTHQATFEKMRSSLEPTEKQPTVFDPNQETAQYLAAMADTHGGEGSPTAADALTGDESIQEIIDIAIGLEKESILFYLGLKDFVPPEYGQDKLDRIIREEQQHIIQLKGFRKKLSFV
jgi:rubrerythrin